MSGFELAIMFLMIAVNSVFAGYEIALASISVGQLKQLTERRIVGASAALYMKENMEASLAVVQLGITLVGAIAAAVGGASAEEKLAPFFAANFGVSERISEVLAIVTVVLPLTVVTIIVGELIPKVFALRNSEWVCLRLSTPMRWFLFSVWPAVWLFESIVMGIMSFGERHAKKSGDKGPDPELAQLQELRGIAALARASRVIGHQEERIIQNATEMPSRPIRDIMLAVEDITTLDVAGSLSDHLIRAHMDMHTRFPVVSSKDNPQSIIGYVNVKDIIAALHLNSQKASVLSILRPLPSFNESLAVASCLEQLMREHTHIALVRGEGGKILGMVTLEDILEELVGEIGDEYDRLPFHLSGTDNNWVAGGGLTIEKFLAVTGIDLNHVSPHPKAITINEWLCGELKAQGELKGGETVEKTGIRVAVRKVRRHKVQEAYITKLA